MDIQREFGQCVRKRRKALGLTQEQLAERCGAGFVLQRIGEVERGEANCTLQTVKAIATGLECEPALLFMFAPTKLGDLAVLQDTRLVALWRDADSQKRNKIIRILSELLD